MSDTKLVRMADILFAERMKNVVGEWRAGLFGGGNRGSKFQGSGNEMDQKFQTTFFQARPALAVNGLTSRQLKLIKLVIQSYPFNCMLLLSIYGASSHVVYSASSLSLINI